MKRTQVVNVRTFKDPSIYVGRRVRFRKGHPLANPFKLASGATDAERDQCMAAYAAWLESAPEADRLLRELAHQVKETGLPLACWCVPEGCHANLLAACVDRMLGAT